MMYFDMYGFPHMLCYLDTNYPTILLDPLASGLC
jgi:hypothetical protein